MDFLTKKKFSSFFVLRYHVVKPQSYRKITSHLSPARQRELSLEKFAQRSLRHTLPLLIQHPPVPKSMAAVYKIPLQALQKRTPPPQTTPSNGVSASSSKRTIKQKSPHPLLSSRGITYRHRDLLNDLYALFFSQPKRRKTRHQN